MLSRNLLAAVVLAVSVALSGIVAGSALAGGGHLPPPKTLLALAAESTLAHKSFHFKMNSQISDSTQTKNLKVWVRSASFVKGDIAILPIEAIRVHGEANIVNKTIWFTVHSKGPNAAVRLWKQPWTCANQTASGLPDATTPPSQIGNIKSLEKWLENLGNRVVFKNLGTTTLNGTPTWDIQLTLNDRLNLHVLHQLFIQELAASGQSKMLGPAFKLPMPLVNMTTNIWINQLNGTIAKTDLKLAVSTKSTSVLIHLGTVETKFGEHVQVAVPAKCL